TPETGAKPDTAGQGIGQRDAMTALSSCKSSAGAFSIFEQEVRRPVDVEPGLLDARRSGVLRISGRPKFMQPATIVLDFQIGGAWDRGIVHAISESGREHNWNMILVSTGVSLEEAAETWQADIVVTSRDGPLARSGRLAEALVIAVGQDRSSEAVPSVCPDDLAIGRLAAKHLLSAGLKQTAVFAYDHSNFARERAAAFRAEIMVGNAVCHSGGEFNNDRNSPDFCSHAAIIHWLKGLPRPCGIFALCDNWAGPLLTYCRHLGLRVPEDVALIGVDNDALVCELSSPPLSSVSVPWRELGRAVVRLICSHLAGRGVADECVRVLPLEVVARRSTDTLSIDDRQLAEVVAWIRDNAHCVISVDDILRAIPTYRQRLERQFRAGLGRTVMAEVRRAHVDLAKRLLVSTNLSMPEIAARSGFSNATLLGVNFRKELGITPSEYRRSARQGIAEANPDQ
ncbi:MAG: helix-turn-helix-domain containing protein AraC type, partial [Phycisphaerales bacterium]|nr:helix-turn-helix-domain containing protein AraC type [Phycisphaerales bacterium]